MELLTRQQVMDMLGMKASHFSKVSNGKVRGLPPIPHLNIGRLQRFRAESVREWILRVEEKSCSGDR